MTGIFLWPRVWFFFRCERVVFFSSCLGLHSLLSRSCITILQAAVSFLVTKNIKNPVTLNFSCEDSKISHWRTVLKDRFPFLPHSAVYIHIYIYNLQGLLKRFGITGAAKRDEFVAASWEMINYSLIIWVKRPTLKDTKPLMNDTVSLIIIIIIIAIWRLRWYQ